MEATGSDNPFTKGSSIFTFCVELQNLGDPTTFTGADPEDVPIPGGPMGENKAQVLSSLYQNHYQDAATKGELEAAAFQMCVWEIVYEDLSTFFATANPGDQVTGLSLLDTDGGDFSATGDAQGLANSWLLNDIFWNSKILDGLIGLTNGTYQDHMALVPLPAPVALAGVGLLGVIFGRKRLQSIVS